MLRVRTLGGAKDATGSPRRNRDLAAREFAVTADRTVGRRGGFSDLCRDPAETKPHSVAELAGPDATTVVLLRAVRPGFAAIRPPHLDSPAAAGIANKGDE